MNWPNRITILRFLLIPVFIVAMVYYRNAIGGEIFRYVAIVVFLFAMITDALDGFLARVLNQQTRIGKILDPLADKILLNAAVIMLTLPNKPLGYRFPYWFTTLIISRDVIIVLGTFFVHFMTGKVTVKPCATGKITTFCLMITIAWVLFKIPFPEVAILITAVLTFISGLSYLRSGTTQLEEEHTDTVSIK